MSHHGAERADAREVVAAVPAGELLEEREQPTRVGIAQANTEAGRILDQVLGGTQLHGTQPKAPRTLIRAIDHTSQVRLLLVEDDAMIGEAIRAGLKREGFAVDWVHDAEAAAQVLRTEPFELVLLDLGLPGSDGLGLLKVLRERGLAVPVLIITARDAVSDRVQGLDAGADDYLIKPFDLEELAARTRALLRRKAGRSAPRIEYLGVVLDPASHRVTRDGAGIALSPREFALLQLLLEQREFPRRERDPGAVARHAMRGRVQHHAQVLDSRRGAAGLAAQQRAGARRQLVQVEGLDEVVICPRIQALHAIGDRIARRDDEHRHGEPALAQDLQEPEPVAPGQTQIEQHQLE